MGKHSKKDKKVTRDRSDSIRSSDDSSKHKKKHIDSSPERKHHKSKKRKLETKEATKAAVIPPQLLTEEDYFKKTDEFHVWLKQEKHKRFEDLSSDKARKYFKKFIEAWNAGELSDMFYSNAIPEDAVAAAKKTAHKWSFVGKLSDKDKRELSTFTDMVHHTPETELAANASAQARPGNSSSGVPAKSARPSVAPRRDDQGPSSSASGVRNGSGQNRGGLRKDQLEEIAPRETGRQAIIDKRKTTGNLLHGAARDREAGMDGLDLSERQTMGGGDDFNSKVSSIRGARMKKEKVMDVRLAAAQQKEEETRRALIAQFGGGGQKITIRPREDT